MKRRFDSEALKAPEHSTVVNAGVVVKRSCTIRNSEDQIKPERLHRMNDNEKVEVSTSITSSSDSSFIGAQRETCEIPVFVGDTTCYLEEKEIEDAIFSLATQRGDKKTFCPSEIPRLILKLNNWRDRMDLTRKVAFRMARSGIVDILQRGVVIESHEFETIRGPMRIRLRSVEPITDSS